MALPRPQASTCKQVTIPPLAVGAPRLRSRPILACCLPIRSREFGVYAEANAAAYPQDAAQNTCTALLAGGERITLPRETITLSAALLHGAATGFAFDTAAITSPIPFTLKNLRASDEISSGLFTLTPEFSLSRYDFAGSASSANRTEQQEAATLDFVSGGPVTAILQIGATQLNYSLETQNADIYELLTGAQDKQDGLWTLSFLAGVAWRNPRIGPGLVAPIAEARADWQPTMLDKITLTASHEIDDPDAISASPYTRTSINLVISHEYLENVTVQALADIAIAQYIHMDLHEFLGNGRIGYAVAGNSCPGLERCLYFQHPTGQ